MKLNNFLKKFIIIIIILFLFNCAITKIPNVIHLELPKKQIVYKFLDDFSEGITKDEFKNNLQELILKASSYNKFSSHVEEMGGLTYNVSEGIDINFDFMADIIKITYAYGKSQYKEVKLDETPSKVFFNLKFKYSPSLVTITPDTQLVVKSDNQYLLEGIPLEYVTNDSKHIISELSNNQIILNKRYSFKGEMDVEFKPESVYSNFERNLPKQDSSPKSFDIKKENLFALKYKNNQYTLKVTIYPYREGSKLSYDVFIPYQIKSTGETTFSKSDDTELKQIIEKIAQE